MSTQSTDTHDHRLARGSMDWTRCAAIGVSIAVAGCFAGWNYGLGVGGWGGMMAAVLGTAVLFACLTQVTAELAAAMPHSAGFDQYVRAGCGPTLGFVAGISVALGLAVATGLALTFTAAYTEGMFGIGGWPVKAALLLAVLGLHLRGASDAVGTTMVVGAIAVGVLLLFCALVGPAFDERHLYSPSAAGQSLFPNGWLGVAQCVPFALFMLLGVEQGAQAAAELERPAYVVPRALAFALGASVLLATLTLVIATGGSGVETLAQADDPMLAALNSAAPAAAQAWAGRLVGLGALVAFVAAFFSIAYGSSRQLHHLASSRSLPSWLGKTNRRGAPANALYLVALIGAVTASFAPESVMVVFIFLMLVTYQLLLFAFLRLRQTHAEMPRPYRAFGGSMSGWVGAALGLVAALCCYQLEMRALTYAIAAIGLLTLYSSWSSRSVVAPAVVAGPAGPTTPDP
jgi:ethanolamine permease